MSSRFFTRSALLPSLAASVFLTSVLSVPSHAQAPIKASKAIATLDVCENAATGQWVYSGVVAVPAASKAGVTAKVDYSVQNKVSESGYLTSYSGLALALPGTVVPIHGFSVEAPALTLGTMRGAARVQLIETTDPTRLAMFDVVTTQAVCGCNPIKGCVRTQGYWGNKPDVVWPSPYSRDALFFSSGLTFQQILDAPVQGSGYLILAKQYIAAVLNRAAGASAPPSIINTINQASTFFSSGTTPASCGPGQCQEQIALAAILDTYNNGVYPGAPRHCPN